MSTTGRGNGLTQHKDGRMANSSMSSYDMGPVVAVVRRLASRSLGFERLGHSLRPKAKAVGSNPIRGIDHGDINSEGLSTNGGITGAKQV